MSKLTDVNLTILADTDCPSDWERDDLLEFAQEAAREILNARAVVVAAKAHAISNEARRERRDIYDQDETRSTLIEALDAYYGEKIL